MYGTEYNTPISGGSDELSDDQMNSLANEPITHDNSSLTDNQMNTLTDEPLTQDNSGWSEEQQNGIANGEGPDDAAFRMDR